MKYISLLAFLITFLAICNSCSNSSAFEHRVKKVKFDTAGKKITFFENGSIREIIDNSKDTMFFGSRYEFDYSGNLIQYSFQIDTICASYIEDYNYNGQKLETMGNPIVYSFSSADEARDSILVKRYISTFGYKDILIETSGIDKYFKTVQLNEEPNLSFIKSFASMQDVKNTKRFVFITKFSGRRIDNDSLKIFYDTTDRTRRM
jgi:hypothetical protein